LNYAAGISFDSLPILFKRQNLNAQLLVERHRQGFISCLILRSKRPNLCDMLYLLGVPTLLPLNQLEAHTFSIAFIIKLVVMVMLAEDR